MVRPSALPVDSALMLMLPVPVDWMMLVPLFMPKAVAPALRALMVMLPLVLCMVLALVPIEKAWPVAPLALIRMLPAPLLSRLPPPTMRKPMVVTPPPVA
jgi:hypothetical protein